MKTVIHFQTSGDYNAETTYRFLKLIKASLGEDYIVIASPFTPTMMQDSEFYNFVMNQISKEDLMLMMKDTK